MVDTLGFPDLDPFLFSCLKNGRLEPVGQGQLKDLLILNVIVLFRVILKDSGIWGHYLKEMLIWRGGASDFEVTLGVNSLQVFFFFRKLRGYTDHHGACIFNDVHSIRFQDGDKNKGVSSF